MVPDKIGLTFPISAEFFKTMTVPSLIEALYEQQGLGDLDHARRLMTDPLYRFHGPAESPEHRCARFGHNFYDVDYDIEGDPETDEQITFRCWACGAGVAFTKDGA